MTPVEAQPVTRPSTPAVALLAALVITMAVGPVSADEDSAGSTPDAAMADPAI